MHVAKRMMSILTLSAVTLAVAQTAPPPAPGQGMPSPTPLVSPTVVPNTGRTYVFVHGALLGKYSWDRITPLLRAAGNTVITLDLPAHGGDTTPANQVSLDRYRDAVIAAIGHHTNVILVGHSFGGIVISEVAGAIPQRIGKLVYLGAYLPQNGETTVSLSTADRGSLFSKYVTFSGGLLNFAREGVRPALCNDCSVADLAMVQARARSEPGAPLNTPLKLSTAFASVPKAVILTGNDHTLSPGFQVRNAARAEVNEVYTIDSDHLPFFTQPLKLADLLLTIR